MFKKRPYNLLLVFAALIFIFGRVFKGKSVLDIHMHDTYFLMPSAFYIFFPVNMLLGCWALYLFTNNFLFSKKLSWAHIILTIYISCFIALSPYILTGSYKGLAGMPRRYLDTGASGGWLFLQKLTRAGILTILILVGGQLIYVFNLGIGVYQHLSTKSNC